MFNRKDCWKLSVIPFVPVTYNFLGKYLKLAHWCEKEIISSCSAKIKAFLHYFLADIQMLVGKAAVWVCNLLLITWLSAINLNNVIDYVYY